MAFADETSDLDFSRDRLVVQIRDEVIDVIVREEAADLFVWENGERSRAFDWLVTRVAKLPLLADRILANIRPQEPFVSPSGKLLDQLNAKPDGADVPVDNLPEEVLRVLSRGLPGTSTVLYVTSDAGEGKTTLINHLARTQALAYKAKTASSLIVPISLGGRSFLTFDDVVVAELVNRLRFQLLYYQAFLELVRLQVIVPAFDGFEEMFVEGSSGEALSALGNLMHDLESRGSVLIAARKAYFEYQSFGTQAKLFDAIGSNSVDFARIALDRWDQKRFVEYATQRGVSEPRVVYDKVRGRLSADHPLLTRAVLVERLVDVAVDEGVDGLLDNLGSAPEDYFYQFVNRIVEREANEKWIDRSGTPHVPLLSLDEHHSLLAFVAREMWVAGTEVLRGDYLDLLAELFADEHKKPPQLARQIINRLKQHSLIVAESSAGSHYAFDHEDFYSFYLGVALGGVLRDGAAKDIASFLQRGVLSHGTVDAALNALKRSGVRLAGTAAALQRIAESSLQTSYTVENCASLLIRLLELAADDEELSIEGLYFGPDSLKGRRFGSVTFSGCHFQPSSIDGATLANVKWIDCVFERLEWTEHANAQGAVLQECTVRCVHPGANDGIAAEFEPAAITDLLTAVGFKVADGTAPSHEEAPARIELHEDTVLAEHALRIFMRATQINEDVFKQRFGTRASRFMDDVLPRMIARGILEEVEYKGSGRQRRFKLCVPMRRIDAAVPATVPDLEGFLSAVGED